MCVNVRKLGVWALVGLAGWSVPLRADVGGPRDSDCTDSAAFTIDNRGGCGVTGLVLQVNAQGQVVGPLSGATVAVSGAGSTTTNSQGQYAFSGLQPGAVTMTVSKSGFYTVTRQVSLAAGESRNETFQMAASGSGVPTPYDFTSPNGRHFIEGMPGDISFAVNVAWNGTPGSVTFDVAGTQYAATITDLGGGYARATVTLPAPITINNCSRLSVLVTNGGGQATVLDTEVYFHPIPAIVPSWSWGPIAWVPTGGKLTNEYQLGWHYEQEVPPGVYRAGGGFDVGGSFSFDPRNGQFGARVNGSGSFGHTLEFANIENISSGTIGLSAGFELEHTACAPPVLASGSWELSFSGRAGIGAPAVLFLDVIVPGMGTTLAGLPIIGDIIKIKLRAFKILGGTLEGTYTAGGGSCFLGASSYELSLTAGLEAQVALDLGWAEGGVYVGGTGSPEFELCPDLEFNALTLRLYVGVFASALGFMYQQEVGTEVRFESNGKRTGGAVGTVVGREAGPVCRPIADHPLKWGEMNRLVQRGGSRSAEETLVENVGKLGSPVLVAEPNEVRIVYSLHDPNKPWFAATDIAALRSINGGPWTLGRVADDLVADFEPQLNNASANRDLAAWAQVDGDISGTTDPGQVAPYLEVAAAWFDRTTGQWTAPVLLVNNDVVDREPHPVVFGTNQGVVWIQNEGSASPGNAQLGDRLMYTAWDGNAWGTPEMLWSAPKGVLGLTFAQDATGEGQIVFAVDEDGDLETRTDRELYSQATVAGVWQAAVRLANDAIEDSLPVLVAPNGTVILIWNAAGTLMYTPLASWNPQPVYAEETLANEAPSLAGATMPSGAAIAYTVQGEDGVDIVAAFYDVPLDKWSLPRQLTHDEHAETSISLACDGTELVMAYLKTQTERNAVDVEIEGVVYHLENVPQPARTDLCLLRHTLGHDLAIQTDSLVVEPANPAPNAVATIHSTIENRGDLMSQAVQVTFYDGDPDNGGTQIGAVQMLSDLLIAGGTREVSVTWNVPDFPEAHTVFVVVDPTLVFDDRDRSNNTASTLTVLPDVMIETGWSDQVALHSVSLVARIVNEGTLPTGAFELSWRLGAVDGPEIGRSSVANLIASGANEVAYTWDTTGQNPGEFVQVYVVADDLNLVAEFNEANNVGSQSVRIPPPQAGDLNADGIISTEDIDLFVNVLLGLDPDPYRLAASDVNLSGTADGLDIQAFVDLLLGR